MDDIYKHSPSINPQFVLDTSKEDQNLESRDDDEPDSQSGKESEADVVRLTGASGKFMCCINFVSAGSLWPMENLESNENQLSDYPCVNVDTLQIIIQTKQLLVQYTIMAKRKSKWEVVELKNA